MMGEYRNDLNFAIERDEKDPLRDYKARFHYPIKRGEPVIYFCGNSLGLQPKSAKEAFQKELDNWRKKAVEGHFEGQQPWMHYHKLSKKPLSGLVGAKAHEVICMNNLTTNLHLMLASFYQPSGRRNKILMESRAFPSDYFAASSFMKMKGVDPDIHLVELEIPHSGYLPTEDIQWKIREIGEELALVLWPGIQYYTGQWFDHRAIASAGHEVGAFVGFDLAHAIGNVPMSLHDEEADFAVWCSYKYLNSGPGNVSGVFIHEKHAANRDFLRLGGWWGQQESSRFEMENVFDPMASADGWQLSNMNIMATCLHHASLDIFQEAGIDNLRKKSLALTGYLEFLLKGSETISSEISILTPSDPKQRGCQLSIYLKARGREVFHYLTENNVVLDWREPNVIRVAPTPLYNSFREVFEFHIILEKAFRHT